MISKQPGKRGKLMLILTIGIGEGHNKVAEALQEELPQAQIIDVLKYINKNLHRIINNAYLNTIKYTPYLWRYSYRKSEEFVEELGFKELISKIAAPKLKKLIKETEPQKIICTHAIAAAFMSYLKPQFGYKLYVVVTDYTIHPMWIQKNIDKYFLPDRDMFIPKQLENKELYFFGIPVRNDFYKPPASKGETILIAGGGLGLGNLNEIANRLLHEDFHIIVLVGKNKKLKEEIEIEVERNGIENLSVVGYTERIIDYYDGARIVITKPGGVTSTELILRRKPSIIYDAIPGQEEYNADYLLKWGTAIKANKKEDISHLTRFLLSNDIRYRQMVEIADYLSLRNDKISLINVIMKD